MSYTPIENAFSISFYILASYYLISEIVPVFSILVL